MKLPDSNVLLHAYTQEAAQHDTARNWLAAALSGTEPVGFAWAALLAFVRIVTKPSVFVDPMRPAEALGLVDAWLSQPCANIVHPTSRHAALIRELLLGAGVAGDLTSDAHLAALAVEHGASLTTFDADFHRFDSMDLEYLT